VTFLKSKVQQLGLTHQVRFVGEVFGEDKEALFAECDVAIVPSHVENFAIVVAESLAHALPVIASKGTPWKGLETNHCGLWVDNDPASLAAAICTIQTMPFREMGAQGRKWMERAFSWRSVSCEMLDLYLGCADVSPMDREQLPEKSIS
jgi:glycosyltransferase involved in cell wall biosynthesis